MLGACEILQYFAAHGNLAADRRLADVYQMCKNLGIPLDRNDHDEHGAPAMQSLDQDGNQTNAAPGVIPYSVLDHDSMLPPQFPSLNMMWQEHGGSSLPQDAMPEDASYEDTTFEHSLLEGNDGMQLTGVTDTDWDMLLQTSLCGNLWEQLCQTT